MVSFFYEIAMYLLAMVTLPKMLYQRMRYGKYKASFAQKMGKDFPEIAKGSRPLIWIHAISLGETKAIATLAKSIKSKVTQGIIIVSSTTETGHQEAKKCMPFADYHVFLPFDLRCIIRPIMQHTAPDLLILTESDFWYNFLSAAKDSKAKIALVNGKISEKSTKRFKRLSSFSKTLFSFFDVMCIQNKYYADRFKQLNVPEEKMIITGNLKFDDVYPVLKDKELEEFKKRLGIANGQLVLVVGSTHSPEEEILLETSQKLWQQFPNLKVILVPRHPERFNDVANLVHQKGIAYSRYSDPSSFNAEAKVVLMDAMGVLRQCYQVADVAYVGGSLTEKVGGHNILEPSWYSVPVVYGPYMHSQPELVTLIKQYHGGIQVHANDIYEVILKLLQDQGLRKLLGSNGLKLIKESQGAKQKTEAALDPIINEILEI